MRRLLVLLKNIASIPGRFFNHISFLCILQDVDIDKTAAVCSGVRFYRGRLGRYSYIGNDSFVTDADIGNFTSISSDCYIGGASHPLQWVSTSPVFHRWKNIMKKNFAKNEFAIFCKTHIGNDVWIGNRVMVKAGVTIGNGAVIGMGSVVTKDIGPYEVWAGDPARLIRKRFEDDIITQLLRSEWWDWPDRDIERHADKFAFPKQFVEGLTEENR